jgi:hypothetical protein
VTFRSRALLDLAHEAPCMASFRHQCTGHLGCEPAHSDSQIHGRGFGHKAADWAVAFMCHEAHRAISAVINPQFDRAQKQAEWYLAHVRTLNWLFENGKLKVAA